ncbi:uncharacterized protein LOC128249785 isoform X1 [Octopus bimaculoides]|uniref:uncharacterized protein LOC128249785 isoform X1 n=1 Tax=Octopus bimaculoides TaxID=37653 RepID=UPI0022E26340|nr:uncharacterized protein LOC128249785 isoform X1 [Octopus bimaculoides]
MKTVLGICLLLFGQVTSEFCFDYARKMCHIAMSTDNLDTVRSEYCSEGKNYVQYSQSLNLYYVINLKVTNIFDNIALLGFKSTGWLNLYTESWNRNRKIKNEIKCYAAKVMCVVLCTFGQVAEWKMHRCLDAIEKLISDTINLSDSF